MAKNRGQSLLEVWVPLDEALFIRGESIILMALPGRGMLNYKEEECQHML